MTFTHEGNKTFVDNMVNFEKMVRLSNESCKRNDLCLCVSPPQEYFLFSPQRIIANTIRQVRHCRSQAFSKSDTPQQMAMTPHNIFVDSNQFSLSLFFCHSRSRHLSTQQKPGGGAGLRQEAVRDRQPEGADTALL